MKKLCSLLLITLLLTGCGGKETRETISDVYDVPTVAVMQKLAIQLPSDMSLPVLESAEAGQLYLCDDYWVTVQTVTSGDLAQTIYNITGMSKDKLDILQSKQGDVKRYQWVWSSNSADGIQVGRACVLDDGAYHYIVTAQATEAVAGNLQSVWQEIFASIHLTAEKEPINTGS